MKRLKKFLDRFKIRKYKPYEMPVEVLHDMCLDLLPYKFSYLNEDVALEIAKVILGDKPAFELIYGNKIKKGNPVKATPEGIRFKIEDIEEGKIYPVEYNGTLYLVTRKGEKIIIYRTGELHNKN